MNKAQRANKELRGHRGLKVPRENKARQDRKGPKAQRANKALQVWLLQPQQ